MPEVKVPLRFCRLSRPLFGHSVLPKIGTLISPQQATDPSAYVPESVLEPPRHRLKVPHPSGTSSLSSLSLLAPFV